MSMVKSRREYLLKVPTHLLTQVLQHLGFLWISDCLEMVDVVSFFWVS